MKFDRFNDLITSNELYFYHSDLFENDKREGLPPEELLAMLGLHTLDVNDRRTLALTMGADSEFVSRDQNHRSLNRRAAVDFMPLQSTKDHLFGKERGSGASFNLHSPFGANCLNF